MYLLKNLVNLSYFIVLFINSELGGGGFGLKSAQG